MTSKIATLDFLILTLIMKNKMHQKISVILIIFCALSSSIFGQSAKKDDSPKTVSPQAKKTLEPALINFFAGKWSCAGEFASKKKIEADVVFDAELENRWLQYRHTDKAPNRFKSLAMWGIDPNSGKLVSTMQDNFGGLRLFTSDDGDWANRTIRFQSATLSPAALKRQERFTYAAESDNKFRMTYEVSSDGNNWKMGDFIVCTKTNETANGGN